MNLNPIFKIGKAHSTACKCHCTFLPPFVLKNMATAGVLLKDNVSLQDISLNLTQSHLSRKSRRNRVSDMAEFASLDSVGNSVRMVYDCEHQWVQQVKLVRDEGGPATGEEAADQVYDFAGKVRDYFKKAHNRSSIDNANMNLILNVHFGVNYQNAFWDGSQMTFGDGDGDIFTSFAKSLDVTAHELAHGVTQWEAALEYDGQSGALNEHFSDVFGSIITQNEEKQTADSADWLIGDEIMGPTLRGESLRSMSDPGTAFDNDLMGKDPQPDHMKNYYTGPDDNHGVHINSGIPNKAFYLSAKEIGTDKAVLVWYHALQNLWATANFNDAVKVICTFSPHTCRKKGNT